MKLQGSLWKAIQGHWVTISKFTNDAKCKILHYIKCNLLSSEIFTCLRNTFNLNANYAHVCSWSHPLESESVFQTQLPLLLTNTIKKLLVSAEQTEVRSQWLTNLHCSFRRSTWWCTSCCVWRRCCSLHPGRRDDFTNTSLGRAALLTWLWLIDCV